MKQIIGEGKTFDFNKVLNSGEYCGYSEMHEGLTLLVLACMGGNEKIVELLLVMALIKILTKLLKEKHA